MMKVMHKKICPMLMEWNEKRRNKENRNGIIEERPNFTVKKSLLDFKIKFIFKKLFLFIPRIRSIFFRK